MSSPPSFKKNNQFLVSRPPGFFCVFFFSSPARSASHCGRKPSWGRRRRSAAILDLMREEEEGWLPGEEVRSRPSPTLKGEEPSPEPEREETPPLPPLPPPEKEPSCPVTSPPSPGERGLLGPSRPEAFLALPSNSSGRGRQGTWLRPFSGGRGGWERGHALMVLTTPFWW